MSLPDDFFEARFRAHVLLCDHAQVAEGKLFINGAGISNVPVGVPTGVAILIYVPWDQTDREIDYLLQLETADGETELRRLDGNQGRFDISGRFEVHRPPHATHGSPLELPLAINVPPLDLVPGRYMWRLRLDGKYDEMWTAGFNLHGPIAPTP